MELMMLRVISPKLRICHLNDNIKNQFDTRSHPPQTPLVVTNRKPGSSGYPSTDSTLRSSSSSQRRGR